MICKLRGASEAFLSFIECFLKGPQWNLILITVEDSHIQNILWHNTHLENGTIKYLKTKSDLNIHTSK